MKTAGQIVKLLLVFAMLGAGAIYAVSIFWPSYSWGIRVPSPDGNFDLVATLGDKAAFDDFFYTIYVFPSEVTPTERKRGANIPYLGVWRNADYLVYSGYSFPGFRWTGPKSVEIDVKPWSGEPASISKFTPVLKSGVLVSLVFGGESELNRFPIEPEAKKPNTPTPASATPRSAARLTNR